MVFLERFLREKGCKLTEIKKVYVEDDLHLTTLENLIGYVDYADVKTKDIIEHNLTAFDFNNNTKAIEDFINYLMLSMIKSLYY